MTVLPGAASCVRRPATPPVAVTLKPGNRMDVLPADAGRALVSVTLTWTPSVTTSVGPGTCIVLQNGVIGMFPGTVADKVAGTNVCPVGVVHPYPQEYTACPSGWVM